MATEEHIDHYRRERSRNLLAASKEVVPSLEQSETQSSLVRSRSSPNLFEQAQAAGTPKVPAFPRVKASSSFTLPRIRTVSVSSRWHVTVPAGPRARGPGIRAESSGPSQFLKQPLATQNQGVNTLKPDSDVRGPRNPGPGRPGAAMLPCRISEWTGPDWIRCFSRLHVSEAARSENVAGLAPIYP
jgi:hypothetical protein